MTTTNAAVRRYGHFIDGAWTDAATTSTITRRSPASGRLVAEFAEGTADDAKGAIAAARVAFDAGPWRRMTGADRGGALHSVAERIRGAAGRLARIEVEESGKTIRTARGDIQGAATHFEHAAGLAGQLHGETFNNLGDSLTGLNMREPVGVVGMIIPWNFPALILTQKLPYALAAGCSVVIKPSEITSGTACEIVAFCAEAGIPPGVVNMVTGTGSVVGQAIAESHQVDMVSFTGSTAVGRSVIAASAGNTKRLSLELGGKAATIVFADADLEDALDGVLFSITFNQGECCVSGTRLLVESSIADGFLARLVERAQRLRVGDPFDESTDIGALIHEEHLQKVLDMVAAGHEDGARLLTGGKRLTGRAFDAGNFIAPTIFDGVAPEARIFQQEIFGPVLSVTRFHGVEEAIGLANDTVYGLANSVWTKNVDTALTVARGLESGTVWVNTAIDGAPQLPLGGYKQSGYGREAGQMGMEEFTNVKSIQIRTGKRTPFYPVA